jgi:hypothetical protein
MIQRVSYVEINSPDRAASERFLGDVFGWRFRPFADPGYLVADHGDADGVETGLLASVDGQPRAIPVIRVPSLDAGRIRRAAMSRSTLSTFTWDQALRGQRGQYRCKNDASSNPRRCPSIHPQHNAPSSASTMPTSGRPAPCLPIRSQACAADAGSPTATTPTRRRRPG